MLRLAPGTSRRVTVGVAVCLAATLLWAPAAKAVRIGAPLDQPATVPGGCAGVILSFSGPPPSCTLLGNGNADGWTSQVPRGEWVIRLARVRTGTFVGPMVFTVIRATRSQAGAGGLICCRVPVESQVFTPTQANAVNEVPVNLPVRNTVDVINGEPIETVDYLGISLLDGQNVSLPMAAPPGSSATTSYIAPAARAGQERLADGTVPFNNVLLVNGEADPAGAGGGGGGGAVPATVDAFDLALARFRAAASGGSVRAAARRRGAPVGSRVTYSLSAAAAVTFTVERRRAGRRVRGKCRKRTAGNRKARKCNLRLKGSFSHQGRQGANSFLFTGRLRNRKLRPGRYTLVARPAGGAAPARRDRFTIVPR